MFLSEPVPHVLRLLKSVHSIDDSALTECQLRIGHLSMNRGGVASFDAVHPFSMKSPYFKLTVIVVAMIGAPLLFLPLRPNYNMKFQVHAVCDNEEAYLNGDADKYKSHAQWSGAAVVGQGLANLASQRIFSLCTEVRVLSREQKLQLRREFIKASARFADASRAGRVDEARHLIRAQARLFHRVNALSLDD